MGGGGDPIGAEVGLEGRGHEHRAVLGRERASGCRPAPALQPPPLHVPSSPRHLLLIALQEGDEEAGDGTGRGVHLGEGQSSDPGRAGGGARVGGEGARLTVWANCSSPASVWNMMWRRRLWKSVQLEALVTWALGAVGVRIEKIGWGGCSVALLPTAGPAGAHLAKAAAARHPGLNVELAVGGQAQLLRGHVQDPAVQEKDMAGASGWGEEEEMGRRKRRDPRRGTWKRWMKMTTAKQRRLRLWLLPPLPAPDLLIFLLY